MEITNKIKENELDDILKGTQTYWNYRAESYSKSNIDELNSFKRDAWLKIILENAPKKDKMKVLDVGTGPGLFSILLSLAGHEVTAVDVTEEMLRNAKKNADDYNLDINFIQINGINLPFEDDEFDLIISRNVVWNLEYPKEVMKEWKRVLNADGHVMYFDANWYLHLFDENQNKLVMEDIKRMEELFNEKYEITPQLQYLDDVARKLVLSKERRPEWDRNALNECGFEILKIEEDIGRYVWDEKQKVEYKSRPLFMIVAK